MSTRITGFGYRSKPRYGQQRTTKESNVPLAFVICLMLLQASLTYIAIDVVTQIQTRSESHE